MHSSQKLIWEKLMFSPDGHLLTGYSWDPKCLVIWDVQTGGPINNISTSWHPGLMSYSGCGTMLGVLSDRGTITTYNTISGTQLSSHSVPKPITGTIWTCGECLQFATVESGSITIWEVSFSSSYGPTQIGSLPLPTSDDLSYGHVFLPAHSWIAFILQERVVVWDAQHEKYLLNSEDVNNPRILFFSPDGCFFICGTWGPEIHLWKESPDGYQKLLSNIGGNNLVFSPNGESFISYGGPMLQLWYTTSSIPSPPGISTQASQHIEDFLLEFSPDESLVAVAQWLGNTATVLNIRTGNPLLVIDTDTKICGMRITESTTIVVGDGKIVTWDLPAEDCTFNIRRNISDSVQTTMLEHSAPNRRLYASISPDLNHIAFGDTVSSKAEDLTIYDMHTGKLLAATGSDGYLPGFTPGGHKVWCATHGEVDQWAIIKDNGSNVTRLESLGKAEEPLSGFPWHSSCGYQVTDDGWILSSSGKWLLWLPHHWRSMDTDRRWSGKSLAIWHSGLLEPVILELGV